MVPRSYNDITVGQFQECYFILGKSPEVEQWITVLSILSGIPEDWYYNIPTEKLKRKIHRLQFLLKPELNTKVKRFIYLDKKIFRASGVPNLMTLTTAQGCDLKEFQKPVEDQELQDRIIENLDKLLASIYLPLTLKGFTYDVKNQEKSANSLRKAKMGDVYGTLFFYSSVYENLMKATLDSGKEATDLLTQHMEKVIAWAQQNPSEVTGVGK